MLERRSLLGLSVLASGCVVDARHESRSSDIAIAGPWQPSASTRAIASRQHVTVVDPPAVSPLGHCTSTNPFACSCTHPACTAAYPGTRDLNAFLLRRYGFLRAGGTYCCRQNSATTRVPMLSVHATGRAIDLMVPMAGGDADNTLGDQAANWLVENAEHIGIQRVIWDHAFWNGERGFGLLSSASLSHTNHIHVELSVAGAARQTPFFTSGASMGTTCAARCDGTRLIATDCSSLDCASAGAPCQAGPPPSCGAPSVAEPAAAVLVPGVALPAVVASAAPARFTFVGPLRLFDTRTPEGSARLVRSGAAGPLTATSSGTFRDWSSAGLPSGTTGVWLNVATVGVEAPGFATAFTAGQPRPPTSTVNYVAGAANANATPVVLGASAGVTFEVINPAHMITDAYGAFSPTGAGLVPAGPIRVLDTRSDVALVSNVPRPIDVRAPAGAVGVVASVTAIAGAGAGFLTAYPCGTPTPPTSNLNFSAGAVVTNTVVSTLGAGQLCLLSNVEAHAIVDVTGFLAPSSGLTYTALTPQRLLDTRQPSSLYAGRLGARQIIELPIQRAPGMPASAVAVVANLTAVSASGPGFVTAFPCGTAVPGTSSLTFPTDTAVGSLTVAALGGGSLCVFSNVRTHLIVDVLGVWTGAPTAPVTSPDPSDDGDDVEPDAGPPVSTDAGMPVVDAGVVMRTDAGVVIATDAGVVVATDAGVAVGTDAGVAVDAAEADAATEGDVLTGGCGCRAGGGRPASGEWSLGVGLMVAGLSRRRRGRP
jgi:MYXO-CTERM domain-containing protein